MFLINIDNFIKWKYHIFKNTSSLFLFTVSVVMNIKKFREEESIEILKILGLINNKEDYQKIYNYAWKKHEWKT